MRRFHVYVKIQRLFKILKFKMESDQVSNTRRSHEQFYNNDDYVVKSMGAFGKWQAAICVLAAITRIPVLLNMHSIIFLTPTTNFACVEFRSNTTKTDTNGKGILQIDEPISEVQNEFNGEHVMSNTKNDSYYDNIQFSIPMPIVQNGTCYDDCVTYEFYKHVFDDTLVTEFNLICDDRWKAGFTQTILMFGFLVGVSLFGWISDRYGRRNGIVMASFLNVVLMMIAPFSYNYWTFNFIRFFIGLTSGGTMIIGIVYILEIVGPKYRELAGSLALLPDGFSEASLSIFAYISPNWRIYILGYSILSVFIVIFVFLLPESPRWLMSKGKDKVALEIMTKAANCNNLKTNHIEENVQIALEEMIMNDKGIRNVNYLNLFKTKDLTYKTIASIVLWTSSGACYFGINQYMTFLGSDIYMTVMLLGFIQVPICPISFLLNKTFGRKPTIITSLFVTSFTMIALTFIPHGHWACTVFGIIGFAASSTTFAIIYIYASELFPTPLRNMAYGLSSAGAKIGAMIAPFIALSSPHWSSAVIFAILPVVASLFCIILPETKGVTLMDSIRY